MDRDIPLQNIEQRLIAWIRADKDARDTHLRPEAFQSGQIHMTIGREFTQSRSHNVGESYFLDRLDKPQNRNKKSAQKYAGNENENGAAAIPHI